MNRLDELKKEMLDVEVLRQNLRTFIRTCNELDPEKAVSEEKMALLDEKYNILMKEATNIAYHDYKKNGGYNEEHKGR
ncbi:MAG: hypothetical protein RSF02_02435 [Bacilli bacterium]